MSGSSPSAPGRVPTLTEVVAWPAPSVSGADRDAAGASGSATASFAGAAPKPADADVASSVAANRFSRDTAAADELIAQRVLVGLQRQLDLMLEYRLREALMPLLSRATDAIVREAKTELASTLREAVARAVAEELARHRAR